MQCDDTGSGIESMNESQKAKIKQLSERIRDVKREIHDDLDLNVWLESAENDVEAAAKAYRKSIAWRQQVGADTILDNFEIPEVLIKYYPGSMFGFDEEGRPIILDCFGQMDTKGLMGSCKRSDILKFIVWKMEFVAHTCRVQSKLLDRRIYQCVQILDMDGFGKNHMWQPGVDLVIEILGILDANYPETLKRTYVINMPKIFQFGWGFIKQFMSERTRNKFLLLDGNWRTRLLEDISADQLPVHWGGELYGSEGDPYCKDKVCLGGKVPASYYISKDELFPVGKPRKTITVPSFTCIDLELRVEKPECGIRWIFTTEKGDINFSLFKKEEEKEKTILEEPKKILCDTIPEDGLTFCDGPGLYIIRFDNRSTWFWSRKVTYYLEVVQHTKTAEGFTSFETQDTEVNEHINEESTDESL